MDLSTLVGTVVAVPSIDSLRVALVHEWLSSRAGSEKTFESMAEAIPGAELYALTHDSSSGLEFSSEVRTTALQRSSLLARHRSIALPLMPFAWRALRPPDFDVVVTSSHAFARYFPTGEAVHLSYVYTPLRYAWLPEVDGRGSSRALAGPRWALRKLDERSVAGVRAFAGISRVVRDRIRDFYGRDASVVYPPVDVDFFADHDHRREDFVLGVSRWIPYKRLDLVIDAAEATGRPAVIAGDGPLGPELAARAARARVPVSLVRSPTDEHLRSLYGRARVVVFPPEEDFGIVPVEAQAAGTPVVALAAGGSLDTVREGVTGALVQEQSLSAFAEGIERAASLGTVLDPPHLAKFARSTFGDRFRAWIESAL